MHARKILKGTRWLLLKNPENLDDERNERNAWQTPWTSTRRLTIAYYLKEDLRQIWQQASKATARRVLDDWIRRAEASGIAMLQRFAAPWRNTATASWRTTTTASRPVLWKASTPKSKP